MPREKVVEVEVDEEDIEGADDPTLEGMGPIGRKCTINRRKEDERAKKAAKTGKTTAP